LETWVYDRIRLIELAFTANYCQSISMAADVIIKCFKSKNNLLICGNGGSASDAQHIAAELVGKFNINRPGLPAIALSTNPAIITAWTNDHEFETVFARQVESLGKPGDILWGISTSGKSKNIICALESAKKMGLITIGMTGNNGGVINDLVDYPLFVEEQHTPLVQEIHVITYHRICEQVELQLFSKPD
jgi:D-sedoheptulose 7-phosphate isomerase